MGDSHAPRHAAVVYAVLSLIARLIAAQSAVFSLWFSRRSFERSRGEMITMLYEKMLTRKVVGLLEKPREEDSEGVAECIVEHSRKSDPKDDQERQSASMGKVLNLMRYVSCQYFNPRAVFLSFLTATTSTKWRKGKESFKHPLSLIAEIPLQDFGSLPLLLRNHLASFSRPSSYGGLLVGLA